MATKTNLLNINSVSSFKINSNKNTFHVKKKTTNFTKSMINVDQMIDENFLSKKKIENTPIPIKVIIKSFFCIGLKDRTSKLYYHSEDILKERLDVMHYLKLTGQFSNLINSEYRL